MKELDELITYIENELIGKHKDIEIIDEAIKKYAELYHAEQLRIGGVGSTFAMEFAEYIAKEHYVLVNQIGKLHYWKNEKKAKITEQLLKDFEKSRE